MPSSPQCEALIANSINNRFLQKITWSGLFLALVLHTPGQSRRGDHLPRFRDYLRLYVVLELVQRIPLRPNRLTLHEVKLIGVAEVVRQLPHEIIRKLSNTIFTFLLRV